MAFYQIGPLCLVTDRAPESCRPFLTDAPSGSLLTVSHSSEPLSLEGWRLLAEHDMMNVWRQEERAAGWLLEDCEGQGWLWVSPDYDCARFYPTGADSEMGFRILLQAVLECALVRLGLLVLHCACVSAEGEAVAFSGPSGSGKSTRAAEWVQTLNAAWISGDRPVVDPETGLVYGVPWDGKEQLFVNTSAPLRAILEVRRGNRTELCRMTRQRARCFLSSQLMIPMWDTPLAARALLGMNRLLERVEVYRLYSDIGAESAKETFQILFRHPERVKNSKEEQNMKLKPGFEIVELEGDYLALPTGDNVADFAGSVVLNEVSATLLRELGSREASREDLLQLVLNEYEVDEAVAAADLDNILKTFAEIGLIE